MSGISSRIALAKAEALATVEVRLSTRQFRRAKACHVPHGRNHSLAQRQRPGKTHAPTRCPSPARAKLHGAAGPREGRVTLSGIVLTTTDPCAPSDRVWRAPDRIGTLPAATAEQSRSETQNLTVARKYIKRLLENVKVVKFLAGNYRERPTSARTWRSRTRLSSLICKSFAVPSPTALAGSIRTP